MSPLEVTTLASIVQAETAKVDERPVVAGLYMNRLDKGIRLQSDPTVIFAMRLAGRQDTIRRVYLSDLKIDSAVQYLQAQRLASFAHQHSRHIVHRRRIGLHPPQLYLHVRFGRAFRLP